MFGNWFKSSSKNEAPQQSWDPNTLTMQQPTSPEAPSTQNVVSEQPRSHEPMHLRGGNEGGGGCCEVCCGVCAGLACFECCETCC